MFRTIRASLPKNRVVRGYEIHRLPLGGYLDALAAVQEAPGELLAALFPGKSTGEVLQELRTIRPEGVQQLITRCMAVAPAILLRLIAALTGIPEKHLRENPAIGLDGLADILLAFLEVNKVENFIRALGPLGQQLSAFFRPQKPGSSDSSPRA